MQFYGIQKVTLVDYPGEVAAALFARGCNFSCGYCHNPELVDNNIKLKPIEWEEIFNYLKKRKNVLGGVCITGGEPLLNEEIKDVISEIHLLGMKVKIDTNGSKPDILEKCNPDYIAMDIKTSFNKYDLVYKRDRALIVQLKRSIDFIIKSDIDHEFRTTAVPGIVDVDDIKEIVKEITGAKRYIISQFRPMITLDKKFQKIIPYDVSVLEEMKNIAENSGINCSIRGI